MPFCAFVTVKTIAPVAGAQIEASETARFASKLFKTVTVGVPFIVPTEQPFGSLTIVIEYVFEAVGETGMFAPDT